MWSLLAINSLSFGGLLFLLSAGFSLIFGLMRIPNLMHGSFFMLGAYVGASLTQRGYDFWLATLVGGVAVLVVGGLVERVLLRRLAGQQLAQVLLTLGLSFIVADLCLMAFGGDPIQPEVPGQLRGSLPAFGVGVSAYRLAVMLLAVAVAAVLWLVIERSRIGAMIRAGVDDAPIARVMGIRVSSLFTAVFCLGAGLAGFAGVIGSPILSVYPGLDADMLPLALIVVILGGAGSLVGALLGSLVIGFLYNFGQAMFPDLSYVILFLPMLIVLLVRPQGLLGRVAL